MSLFSKLFGKKHEEPSSQKRYPNEQEFIEHFAEFCLQVIQGEQDSVRSMIKESLLQDDVSICNSIAAMQMDALCDYMFKKDITEPLLIADTEAVAKAVEEILISKIDQL